jgi:hypothetical protein
MIYQKKWLKINISRIVPKILQNLSIQRSSSPTLSNCIVHPSLKRLTSGNLPISASSDLYYDTSANFPNIFNYDILQHKTWTSATTFQFESYECLYEFLCVPSWPSSIICPPALEHSTYSTRILNLRHSSSVRPTIQQLGIHRYHLCCETLVSRF